MELPLRPIGEVRLLVLPRPPPPHLPREHLKMHEIPWLLLVYVGTQGHPPSASWGSGRGATGARL